MKSGEQPGANVRLRMDFVTEGPQSGASRSSYRWTICALLFVATTINYVDRQVLGILAPTLQRELHWTEADYGDIVSWFSLAYAFGFLAAGRAMDWIGVRRGLGTAVVAWSFAAIGHAFARTAAGFSIARAMLGVSESAIFPGSIKAIAEWFPQRERALATGIFNAGTNMGAIITPLLVPWIALRWGWQWAFVVGKLMADPVWWFYLYWLPKFLDAKYGVKLAQVAAPIIVVYLIADVGSVGGGWISSALIKRGWSVNRARKTTMLAMALLIVPTTLVSRAPNMWAAVLIVGVAAAAHQAWSANVYTLASDMFPKSAVGSVVGICAFAGAMGGVVFQRVTGRVLQANGSDYAPIFVVCGLAYVTAWVIIHLLAPRLEPARLATGRHDPLL